MRSKELRIGGEKKEAVLVAGGSGFKVYTISGLNGWALTLGRKISFIEDKTPAAQTIANYVNLKYHSLKSQEAIRQEFNLLIDGLSERDVDSTV